MGLILTNKGLVLFARCKGRVACLVTNGKFGRLGYGVLVSAPNEFDSIADRCIDGKRHISENTFCRSNYDSVGYPFAATSRAGSRRGRHVHGRWGTILSHTFCHRAN